MKLATPSLKSGRNFDSSIKIRDRCSEELSGCVASAYTCSFITFIDAGDTFDAKSLA